MKTISETVFWLAFFLFVVIGPPVAFVALIGQLVKPLKAGTTTTQGTVIRVSQNTLRSCVELSKTTVGESALEEFCTFRDVRPALPEVGDKVKLIYRRSPYILMDTIELGGH